MVADVTRHLRFAFRRLLRSPGFAIVAALTLALGIGTNTAIFSVVDAALLRPLPYPDAGRIVRIYESRDRGVWTMSPPNFVDFRDGAGSFTAMGASAETSYALTGEGPAEQVSAAAVTPAFFGALEVGPALGRTFSREEGEPGTGDAVVLSHGLWQERFGGRPDIVGRSVRLDGRDRKVVGVMPRGFAYPRGARLWTPLSFTADELATQRGAHYLDVVGRLRPGVSLEAARSDLDRVAANLAKAYPKYDQGMASAVTTLRQSLVGDVKPALLMLFGAAGLVFLIACVNVANLLLVRMSHRRSEFAVRAALGAGRWRLAGDFLTESLLLGLAGGVAGAVLALAVGPLLAAARAADIPGLSGVRIDGPVLLFVLGVSGLAGLLLGLLPALRLGRSARVSEELRVGGRGSSESRRASRGHSILIVTQMALAVALLVGAGLLLRSLWALQNTDPGFDPRGVVTFSVSLPNQRYGDPSERAGFVRSFLGRIRSLPAVQSVGGTSVLPMSGDRYRISVHSVDGHPLSDEEQDRWSPQVRVVTPGYLEAMRIRTEAGRRLGPGDGPEATGAVLLGRETARRLFGNAPATGHTVVIGTSFGLGRGRAGGQIVGVVDDVHGASLARTPDPTLYLSYDQYPVDFMTFAVRTRGDPMAVVGPIRSRLRELDPDLPLFTVRPMTDLVSDSAARARLYATLLGTFAGLALLLAAVGMYGVMAYIVTRRTPEFGVRIALGARPRDILGLVLRRGALLSLVGAGLGLTGALGASRVLVGLLYGVGPTDPITLIAVPVLLTGVAIAACLVPARRATSTDPMTVLRAE
jgi:putative ABC transport system permease protein